LLYCAAALFSVGNGLLWPSFLALLSRYASDRYQGAVQGLSGSVGSLASIIGLIGGGLLYGAVGPSMFLVPAVLISAAVAFSLRFVALSSAPINE
jgi:MFS family permease